MKRLFKKLAIPVIVLGLIVAGVLYVRNWWNFKMESAALQGEIRTYYQNQGAKAASLSLELARPYLTDEQYGRYAQRVDMLDEYYRRPHFPFEFADDSYVGIMALICFDEFDQWAMLKLYKEVNIVAANERDSRRQLLETTPREVIIQMHQPLQGIGWLQAGFYDDDFDREKLTKTRTDFQKEKMEFEAALIKAKEQCDKKRGG